MTLTDEADARAFCADLTDATGMARLERLAAMIVAENALQNLIAKASESTIWQRHLADSAQLLTYVSRETAPWLDLGTGAGFPGLVVAAMRPDTEIVLVESRKKRSDWLIRAASDLGLPGCRVEGKKLEHVGSFTASVISARAFAPLPRLLALSDRFSTQDTLWLLPKGRSAVQELANLPPRTARMFHVEHSVTDPEAGIVIGTGRPASP
jgi:16S rRNA (guanine527-N7)-methyltransferase